MVTASAAICNIDCAMTAVSHRSNPPRNADICFDNRVPCAYSARTWRAIGGARSENSEMLAQIDVVILERGGGSDHGHPAAVENNDIVCDIEHQFRVLLHQNDRKSAFLELANGSHHFGHDLRRQPLG